MEKHYREIWEAYALSWKSDKDDEKLALFEQSLDKECTYTDPLTITHGWETLLAYMKEFHEKIPGGHFETTYFLTHNDRSIAQWNMRAGNGEVVGTGISYGQYGAHGKLVAMTGFYEVPEEG